MGEVIQRAMVQGALVEVLRLPGGELSYRSSARGYAIYSSTPERAEEVARWLHGRL